MTSESLALIRSANSRISNFLARVPDLSGAGGGPPVNLASLQKQLAAISTLIDSAGPHLRVSQTLDLEERAQVGVYAANLERLKSFIIALETYAGARRRHLEERARQVKEALAWCATLKLTAPE
jgi:hypothetical protein